MALHSRSDRSGASGESVGDWLRLAKLSGSLLRAGMHRRRERPPGLRPQGHGEVEIRLTR